LRSDDEEEYDEEKVAERTHSRAYFVTVWCERKRYSCKKRADLYGKVVEVEDARDCQAPAYGEDQEELLRFRGKILLGEGKCILCYEKQD
jgi:hypothetical protein